MAGTIYVIGLGPGTREFITPAALQSLTRAKILVGGQRFLTLFSHLEKETFPIKNNLPQVKDFLLANRERGPIAVLVSGDPGFFSLLDYVKKHFPPEDLEVIPGISSLQLAFARLQEPWWNYRTLSLHGRSLAQLDQLPPNTPVALLTEPGNSPARGAQYLLELGWESRLPTAVCADLGYSQEAIWRGTLAGAVNYRGSTAAVMVVMSNG